jgi:hypothetical protein
MKRLSDFFEKTGTYVRMSPTQQKVVQRGHSRNKVSKAKNK